MPTDPAVIIESIEYVRYHLENLESLVRELGYLYFMTKDSEDDTMSEPMARSEFERVEGLIEEHKRGYEEHLNRLKDQAMEESHQQMVEISLDTVAEFEQRFQKIMNDYEMTYLYT